MDTISRNMDRLIIHMVNCMSNQGNYPTNAACYVCDDGTRCIIGYLLPSRITSKIEGFGISNPESEEAVTYIASTFGIKDLASLTWLLNEAQRCHDNAMAADVPFEAYIQGLEGRLKLYHLQHPEEC